MRVCPQHAGQVVTFRARHLTGDVYSRTLESPWCPHGHEPRGWLVLDTRKGVVVAAGASDRRAEQSVAVAFDIEEPARHDAHVLVGGAVAPVAP